LTVFSTDLNCISYLLGF